MFYKVVPRIKTSKELQPRNFDVVALQEVCLEEEQVLDWPGRQTNSRFYLSGGKDKKLGTGFIVRGKMQDRVFGFTAISERMCKLRIRGRFFNYSIINVHCPHEEKTDDEKEAFYATLEEVYDGCPRQDVKIIIGDMNARFVWCIGTKINKHTYTISSCVKFCGAEPLRML
ncbi:uncharacterized protein LOC120417383 [Culex pipiens pallens]|uniref:uncharacterized protein LOC120417383 n=1 Tax=Culex pipiens pallens TaxID=42434 RepID=UPI0019546497|nr:uncharacterized protein LOC120417383 [Culex pipiens pallens]